MAVKFLKLMFNLFTLKNLQKTKFKNNFEYKLIFNEDGTIFF